MNAGRWKERLRDLEIKKEVGFLFTYPTTKPLCCLVSYSFLKQNIRKLVLHRTIFRTQTKITYRKSEFFGHEMVIGGHRTD